MSDQWKEGSIFYKDNEIPSQKLRSLQKQAKLSMREPYEKKPCDKPCIRKVFRPLGIYAKCFGLFPCYDLSFVEKLDKKGVKFIHVLDYLYTALVCAVMTGGGFLCFYMEPGMLLEMKTGAEVTDYWVIKINFYLTIVMGVLSLFVFPKSSCVLMRYLKHFAHVDKILQFDGRFARCEKKFASRVLIHLVMLLFATAIIWYLLFVVGLRVVQPRWVDYFLIPIVTLAVTVHSIPAAFFVFFLNSIRARILQFNDKVKLIILPITPSCFACKSFCDYGKELDDKMIETKSEELAFDIEKLRILHGELSDLVYETSSIFGPHLIRDFAFSICSIIMFSYFLLFLTDDVDRPGNFWYIYIFLDFVMMSRIMIMCYYGDLIKYEASILLKLLQKVSALRLSSECNTQIQMFIKKLDKKTVITASEFFTIDKRLLTTIVGSITTYFIILIQFKMTDLSQEFIEWKKACNITAL